MKRYSIEKFIDEKTIKSYVEKIAKNIVKDEKELTFITVLEGARIFSMDLIKEINKIKPDLKINNYFMKLSSYGNDTVSSGKIVVNKDLDEDIENKDIIIIEGIIDTGNTLKFLKNYLLENKNVHSVKICTLFDKSSRREVEVNIDYLGADIPDKFIVGYGEDYAEKHRELHYIGIVNFKE